MDILSLSVSLNKLNPVDQIVEIFCTVSDNKGIDQVQLWINSNHYNNSLWIRRNPQALRDAYLKI